MPLVHPPAENQVEKTKLRFESLTKTSKAQIRSFTSLQMFHTHTDARGVPSGKAWFAELIHFSGLNVNAAISARNLA